ncbi:hypothetical protein BC835DRAFT_1423011 [Cytidiella melzeri]|nr:hypothetical protein BC835DRAFT_1423011 [Cytidiella melzeri]
MSDAVFNDTVDLKVPGADLTADSVPIYEYLFSRAAANLDHEAVLVLQDNGVEEQATLTGVKWRHIIAAVHSRAAELVQLTGTSPRALGDAPFVVGLLAHNGYNYLVTWMALLTLRWTPVLISPANSPDAVLRLLEITRTACLLLDKDLQVRYKDRTADVFDVKVAILPVFDLSTLQQEDQLQIEALLQYVEQVKQGHNANALRKEAQTSGMYMHTSGSTGHPKAIALPHAYLNHKMRQSASEYPDGKGRLMYTPFPLYHGVGYSMCTGVIAGYGGISTLVEPYQAPSPASVLRHLRILKDKKPDVCMIPRLLEEIVDTLGLSKALDYFRMPNTVTYGGTPLRSDVGDKLARGGVRLFTWGGTTETGAFASQIFDPARDPSEWQYFKVVEGYTFNFTPFDAENPDRGYQLVVSPKIMSPPVMNHEDPRGYLMPDMWLRHPDPNKSDLWKVAGRLDDIVALSNGEKANGKQLQQSLCASPYISHVVVFGTGRLRCGVILRPSTEYRFSAGDEEAKKAFLSTVWPYIDTQANETVPWHTRLLQPLVLVEDPSIPFRFSDKGSIKTKATLDLYQEEVDKAYRKVEEHWPPSENSTQ